MMTPEDAGIAAYMAALEEVEIVPPLTHAAASELISRAVVAGVRAAIRAAIAAEREACAALVESEIDTSGEWQNETGKTMDRFAESLAAAIRARS